VPWKTGHVTAAYILLVEEPFKISLSEDQTVYDLFDRPLSNNSDIGR
jgi:hypothetical protein